MGLEWGTLGSHPSPEPPMREARPTDSTRPDPLRARLEAWLNEQNQALLEGVMATWQQSLQRFQPDELLLEGLRESLAQSAPFVPSETSDAPLATALDLVETANSQGDLLKRLLDALVPLVERSALFILKQGLASLYAQRGFESDGPAKPGAVVPPPELEALIQGLVRSIRRKGPGYAALLTPLGPFEAAEAAIFPIHHRKKTVALLLVDSGLRNRLDHPDQVRALAHAASAMLGALAAAKDDEASAKAPAPHPAVPAPVFQAAPAAMAPAQALPEAVHPSAPTERLADPLEATAPQEMDPRTQASAERLARVLVGDIELYFPAKVAQARSTGNLYRLLRDELERSRATFVERFGEAFERQAHVFSKTLIQQLCEGDPGKLGAHPWD